MNKSVMKIFSKANSIDCEKKVLKVLLLYILILRATIFQELNAQSVDIPVFGLNAFESEEILIEFPDELSDMDISGNENIVSKINAAGLKPGYTLLLDSVVEFKHDELFSQYRRSYYYYNKLNKVDSVYRYFYNNYNDYMNMMEISTFNSDGSLNTYTLHQSETSTIEEYKYTDGNLISKIKIGRGNTPVDTIQYNRYIYNEQAKLVYDSIFRLSGYWITNYDTTYSYQWDVYHYTYDSLNRLESKYGPGQLSVEKYSYDSLNRMESILIYNSRGVVLVRKYSYEETDTSLLKLKQYATVSGIEYEMPIDIDTITKFYDSYSIYYTFNKEGQRTSMEGRYWSINNGEEKRIRTVYEYTQQGKLLHAIIYLNWKGTKYEGNLMESSHIDCTYDEEGNLLVYEKNIFDIRTGDWMLFNRKEYYHSPVKNILGTVENKFTALNLYPNPVQNTINIKGDFSTHSYYTIVNLAGTIIARGTVMKNTIDVSRLTPGFYIIFVETDSGLHTGNFVKY
ncbi:MAG: T9SS type A sorting domain-containing protein [Bacteroidales bacterium]